MGQLGSDNVRNAASDAIKVKASRTWFRCIHRVASADAAPAGRLSAFINLIAVGMKNPKIAAPIEAVWRAYNSPEDIKIWNTASPDWHTTAAAVDLRVGGKFWSRMEAKDGSSGFDFAGEYSNIVPQRLLEYTFGDRVGKVEFSEGPRGVTVTVTFDSESSNSEEQQRAGWQAILNSFGRHVEALQRLTQGPAASHS